MLGRDHYHRENTICCYQSTRLKYSYDTTVSYLPLFIYSKQPTCKHLIFSRRSQATMTIDVAAEFSKQDDLTTPLYDPSCNENSARPEENGINKNIDDDKEPIFGRKSTSDTTAKRAAYAAMFAVFVDAINMMCIAPNLPIMVTPGLHQDSFPSTEPFDIATAQYAHDAVEALGMVISNFVFGYIADRIGSRKAILLLMIGSCCTSVGIYLVRSNYWSFIAMTFVNGKYTSLFSFANKSRQDRA